MVKGVAMNTEKDTKENDQLARRLRTARKISGHKQKDVAQLLNQSQSYVSKIKSGKRRITCVQLSEFARIYKADMRRFLD